MAEIKHINGKSSGDESESRIDSNTNADADNNGAIGIDPTLEPVSGKKRGRPSGKSSGSSGKSGVGNSDGNNGKTGKNQKTLVIKSSDLQFLHAAVGAAIQPHNPQLALVIPISAEQGDQMADSINELASFYSFMPDPKTAATVRLAFCFFSIYAGKAVLYAQIKQQNIVAEN